MASSPPPEVTISTVLNVPVRVPGSSRMCVPPLINTGAGRVPLGGQDGRALTRDLEHAVDRRAASAEQAPVAARRTGPLSRDRHPALALLDGLGALSRLPLSAGARPRRYAPPSTATGTSPRSVIR